MRARPYLPTFLLAALIFALSSSATAAQQAFADRLTPDWTAPSLLAQVQAAESPEQTTPATSPAPAEPTQPAAEDPKKEEHPAPMHTGFGALVRTIGADFLAFPKRPSTWVILGIGAGGALLTHPADDTLNAHLTSDFASKFFAPGQFIGAAYTQAAVSAGLYLVGRYITPSTEGQPRTNKYSHLGYDLLRAQLVAQTFVHAIKSSVQRDRPTGECCSFPSGHAASAFAAASVLERHLGYRAAWPTLVIATYVGTSRLHDNRHFISDVMFGSALGMATGWTIVGRHGRDEYSLVPVPVRGGFEMALTKNFGRSMN